jgi:3-dehydroquinate synthase
MSESVVVKSLFRDYNVHFVGDFFAIILKDLVDGHAFFIVDAFVWDIYKERLKGVIPDERLLIVKANESNKSLDKCREIIETLVERQVRRNEKLVAIGGGIIQDITAFSASILYRGIDWSFFPTTLLAQADSCIGSKTSINLGVKKNLIGNFYPPCAIYIDTVFLDTLSIDDIKSGIGEILHFYLYAGSTLFDELLGDYNGVVNDRSFLVRYIQESLKIKKSVIEVDEFDKGERNKFNYGHTFGHAIETITDYGIKHGQAVTVGMDIANYLSVRTGLMDQPLFDVLHAKLAVNFPNYDFGQCDMNAYFDALAKDKKNIGNNLGCILSEGPGRLVRQQVPFDDILKDMIRTYFSSRVYKTSQ